MNYIYGIEFRVVLMSVIIGIFLTSMIYEKTGLASGGIIAPAIISLFVPKPIFILMTMILVVILHYLISFLRRKTILYGRRLYSTTILLGVSLTVLTRVIFDGLNVIGYGMFVDDGQNIVRLPLVQFNVPDILVSLGMGMNYYGYVIGLLITAIIVNDTQSQGLKKTLAILLGISVTTFALVSFIKYTIW